MNTVEFSSLCHMYGWKRIGKRNARNVTIQHERGVKVVIPRHLLLLASDVQIHAILKFAAQIGMEVQGG